MDSVTPERVAAILGGAAQVRVLVVGDLMLDLYLSGAVSRISPEAPVPVVLVEGERAAVGGAGNVAGNVTALGARCSLVGVVGQDSEADRLLRGLESLGVDTDGVLATSTRPTTSKTRVLARRQQVVRFDREVETDVDRDLADGLIAAIRDGVSRCDVVILEDYNKGVLSAQVIRAALEAAEAAGIPTVVDPKRRNFQAFGGATVFKPNAVELSDAVGDFLHPDDPEWMERTRVRLSAQNLLLTLGERGMALRTVDGRSVRVPTVARDVYDVSGAGDTVTAAVAVALAAGADVAEAAIVANHAAAIEVGKAGVATVSPSELIEQSRRHAASRTPRSEP